jgi:UDP-N-acetyl-D-galactosamine dehydrogenase
MKPGELKALCRTEKPVLADIKALYDRNDAADAGFTVFRF